MLPKLFISLQNHLFHLLPFSGFKFWDGPERHTQLFTLRVSYILLNMELLAKHYYISMFVLFPDNLEYPVSLQKINERLTPSLNMERSHSPSVSDGEDFIISQWILMKDSIHFMHLCSLFGHISLPSVLGILQVHYNLCT